MKICVRCHNNKELSDFGFKSSKNDTNICKNCHSKPSPYKDIDISIFTFIKFCEGCNKYLAQNTNNFFKKLKGLSAKCKICSKLQNDNYYKESTSNILNQKKVYYIENKEKIVNSRKEYRKTEACAIYYKKLYKIRKNNPIENFKKRVSTRIMSYLKSTGKRKCDFTVNILKCNKNELYLHLIKSFEMNYKIPWKDTYLEIVHIDHIIPISIAISKDDVISLNHYTNLQLLYKTDNLLKNNNIEWKLDLKITDIYKEIQKYH